MDLPVGELCGQRPLAIGVLLRRGIDVRRTMVAVDEALLADLTAAEDRLASPWRNRPVTELLDHVMRSYHRPFATMMDETVAAIGAARATLDAPGCGELARQLAELRADMEEHMDKEERVLFPWLRGRADTAAEPIRAMQLEHADTIGLILAVHDRGSRVLDRSRGPLAETAGCRLDELVRALCEHIHLENNELFPRALDASTRGR